jgi:hypothetical protein
MFNANNPILIPFHSYEGCQMTYPASLLPHLLVGWQKVADRYKMPIYVFQTGDTYHAVSNEAQGVGRLVDTLAPDAGSGAGRLAEKWRHHRSTAGR